jgi:deoxyribose-phosphate aldolase
MNEQLYSDIAGMIDHAVLKPSATAADVINGAEIALKYRTASLCVRPSDVATVAPLLSGSSVKLSTVVAFPHGAEVTTIKLQAIEHALAAGVEELDVVLNIGQLVSGNTGYVEEEIVRIAAAIQNAGRKVKIIFENCYLKEEHIIAACSVCSNAGVDWVKTSTGFGPYGAREEDVRIMRARTPDHIGVKASGGIRCLDDLLLFKNLGCSRIGTSSTSSILQEFTERIRNEQG